MECPQCTLRYNSTSRLPLITPCSHTICQECIVAYRYCPNCKEMIPRQQRDNSLSQAKNINYSILNIVEHSIDHIDKFIKVCFVGDNGVGKTSLIRMLRGQQFHQNLPATVGFDFTFVDRIIQGYRVRFQLWDSAGQQKFRSIAPLHYKNAHIVIIVYDVSQNRGISNWIKQTLQHSAIQTEIMIVGNKIDLEEGRVSRIMTTEDWELVDEYSKEFYNVLTSCALAEGTEHLWKTLQDIFLILRNKNKKDLSSSFFGNSFSIGIREKDQNHNKTCCSNI